MSVADKSPTIDGKLAEGEWPTAQFSLAETPGRTPVKSLPASAAMSHDAKMLYVSLAVPLPPGGKLSPGESWGQHDGAEVCLQAMKGGKPAGPIYVIHGFASGKFESVTDAGGTVAPPAEGSSVACRLTLCRQSPCEDGLAHGPSVTTPTTPGAEAVGHRCPLVPRACRDCAHRPFVYGPWSRLPWLGVITCTFPAR